MSVSRDPVKEPLFIGSDPEFGLINSSENHCDASNYISDYHHANKLGLDGCNSIGELRPSAGCDPIVHLIEIRNVLRYSKRTIKSLKMTAGSMVGGAPMGGHIHLSYGDNGRIINYDDCLSISEALDHMVAFPVMLISRSSTHRSRCRGGSGYGALSSFEYGKRHGGFEYRSLPSWIVSMPIARSVLSISYVVAFEALYRKFKIPDECNFFHSKSLSSTNRHILANDYYDGQAKRLLPYVNIVKQTIRKMELYPEYAPYIESLFGIANAWNKPKPKSREWDEVEDLRNRWFKARKLKSESVPTSGEEEEEEEDKQERDRNERLVQIQVRFVPTQVNDSCNEYTINDSIYFTIEDRLIDEICSRLLAVPIRCLVRIYGTNDNRPPIILGLDYQRNAAARQRISYDSVVAAIEGTAEDIAMTTEDVEISANGRGYETRWSFPPTSKPKYSIGINMAMREDTVRCIDIVNRLLGFLDSISEVPSGGQYT